MENASRALLIAGGVLIVILIASFGVYFSRTMAEYTSRTYRKLEESKRTEFNQQFLNFDGKKVNIQDIVTIINLAKDSNKKNELEEMESPTDPKNDKSLYVKVKFSNSGYTLGKPVGGSEGLSSDVCEKLEKLEQEDINKLIKNEITNDSLHYFDCKVYENNYTGYVNYIEIQ